MQRKYCSQQKRNQPFAFQNPVLNEFLIEQKPAKMKSPSKQTFKMNPSLICYENILPVKNCTKQISNSSSQISTIFNGRVSLVQEQINISNNSIKDLIFKICQKDTIIKKYQCKLKQQNQKIIYFNKIIQEYIEVNQNFVYQCKQKFSYFENYFKKINKQSNALIQQMQKDFCKEIENKNKRINRLENQIKLKENKINTASFTKRQSQLSFGLRQASITKQKQQYQRYIFNLKQQNQKAINLYQQRILEKQQTIRKMAQFNNQMCQTFLKKRQDNQNSIFFYQKIFRDNNNNIEQTNKQLLNNNNNRQSILIRAKSQRQFDIVKQKMNKQISTLQEQNCYLKKEFRYIQQQNELIKNYLDFANEKINVLQTIVKQKELKIQDSTKIIQSKNIKDNKNQIKKQTIFDIRESLFNSHVYSSIFSNNNQQNNKLNNNCSETLKKDLFQLMKNHQIPQVTEVSFKMQKQKAQKIQSQNISNETLNQNISKKYHYKNQIIDNDINTTKRLTNYKKYQKIEERFEIQRKKVLALQQSLNSQKQMNKMMMNKIKNLEEMCSQLQVSKEMNNQQKINSSNCNSIEKIKESIAKAIKVSEKKKSSLINFDEQENIISPKSTIKVKYYKSPKKINFC